MDRKTMMATLCVATFALCGWGTPVLDCDTNAQILGIGTNARISTGSKTYTIELWMKPTVLETGERRCLGQFSGYKGRMLVAYTGGTAGIFNGGGNGWTTGTTKFERNAWYHVAFVFDDSSAIKTAVYVNGVLEGSNTTEAAGIDERYLTLGGATASRLTSETTREYEAFKGRIADVRVWSVARSQAEIVANYQKRLAGDEAGLIAYWPLDAFYDNGQTVEETRTGDRNVVVQHYSIVEDSGLTLAPADHRAGGYQRRCASWGSSARGLETDIRTSLGSSFTLETWVCPSSSNNGEHWILDQFYGTEGRFLFSFTDNQPGFFVGGSTTSGHVRVPGTLEIGTWTHLALTREGYDFTIYTNGIAAVTANVPGAYVTKDGYPFCICSSATPGGNGNRGVPFTGSQREVRVWNFCRTGEQIRETMGKTLIGNEAGLRGYWPLDEGNGSNIINRVTGVSCKNVIAEPIWEWLSLPPVAHTPGPNLEKTAAFPGDCLTGVDTGTNITTATYTLEAWIRIRSAEQAKNDVPIATQFDSYSGGANMIFGVHYDYRLAHLQDGHASTWLYGESRIPLNRWVHVAYVQDGSLRRLYVDGVLDGEVDDGVVAKPIASQPLRIGYITHLRPSYGRRWGMDGSIAEVRFWNCARTAAEIAKYRTHRLSGKEFGLVGYWPLNDGANGTAANLANGSTPGTVFATWDTLDDLSFEEPLKLGFSILIR